MIDTPDVPKRNWKDQTRDTVSVGISAIPYAGSPAAKLFETFVESPIEQRRNAWLQDLYSGFAQLADKIPDLDQKIQENQQAVSALLIASPLAIKTHRKEKRQAFRNAVLNSLARPLEDDDRSAMFLQIIDRYTTIHLDIVQFFDEPEKYQPINNGLQMRTAPVRDFVCEAFHRDNISLELFNIALEEVQRDGLVLGELPTNSTNSSAIYRTRRTSELGQAFMEFIRDPEESDT